MKVIGKKVAVPYAAFRDRAAAGRRLVDALRLYPDPETFVLAVPRGGVMVAEPVAKALNAAICPVPCRKLPVPGSPESGFGAVTLDRTVALNDRLVQLIGLDSESIDRVVDEVLAEVRRRAEVYAGYAQLADAKGKHVYLVDDGLATGYTVIAAAKMAQNQDPKKLTLLVPASPADSLERVEPYVDEVHCLIAQASPPFAVASYYGSFPDLSDEQVKAVLERSRQWTTGNSGAQG